MAAYLNAFDAGLRSALNAIDDVSRLLDSRAGVQLPKIAVVGDQSSGKSSLLESIFGFSLPRGEEIVTRTPIQVEHRHSTGPEHAVLSYRPPAGSAAAAEAPASGLVERRIDDLAGIEAAVREATDVVAGSDKGIVDSTIYLRVYSASNPDLTVLDLPGITRNPVAGQPENVEEIVTGMINKHLEGGMTVILCVVPAHVDFSTAAAIKMAKQHDPERRRTMGVVTKIDAVEAGVDIMARIRGSSLGLGFIPVRNRTTRELREGVPLGSVRATERAFFASSQQLADLNPSRRGVDALVQQLVKVQLECVCSALPDLKKQVLRKLEESRELLRQLDETVVSSEGEAQIRATQLVVRLGSILYQLRQGDYATLQADLGLSPEAVSQLKVPRHVSDLGKVYVRQVEEACSVAWFLGDECFQELQDGARDFSGVTLPNFLSHPLFRSVFLQRVQRELEAPALQLLESTQEYVQEVVEALLDCRKLGRHFPRLAAALKEHARDQLRKVARECRQQIQGLVKAQRYVQTHNHYFADTLGKVKAEVTAERTRRKLAPAAAAAPAAPAYKDSGFGAPQPRQPHVFAFGGSSFAVPKEEPSAPTAAATAPTGFGWGAAAPPLQQSAEYSVEALAARESNEDQGIVEMQITLFSYTKVVLKRVSDNVALLVRAMLVEQFGDDLATCLQQGLMASAGASAEASGRSVPAELLQLMSDSAQVQQRQDMHSVVESLEKAARRLRNIAA